MEQLNLFRGIEEPARSGRNWVGRFLIRTMSRHSQNQKKLRAHYWDGSDTVCRTWSTGGIRNLARYLVCDTAEGREICETCRAKAVAAGLVEAEPGERTVAWRHEKEPLENRVGRFLMKGSSHNKRRVHYWDGTDTFCRMWLTGGLTGGAKPTFTKSKFRVSDSAEGREICQICAERAPPTAGVVPTVLEQTQHHADDVPWA